MTRPRTHRIKHLHLPTAQLVAQHLTVTLALQVRSFIKHSTIRGNIHDTYQTNERNKLSLTNREVERKELCYRATCFPFSWRGRASDRKKNMKKRNKEKKSQPINPFQTKTRPFLPDQLPHILIKLGYLLWRLPMFRFLNVGWVGVWQVVAINELVIVRTISKTHACRSLLLKASPHTQRISLRPSSRTSDKIGSLAREPGAATTGL